LKDRAPKLKGLAWALAACALGLLFAAGLSPLAHLVPWSLEKRLAKLGSLDTKSRDCRQGAEAAALLKRLVARLYPLGPQDAGFPIEVSLAKNAAVNAYAGFGGQVTVNSGLLLKAQSAEELAAVLAHEIEHVRHRHIMEGAIVRLFTAEGLRLVFGSAPASDLAGYVLNMDFTRSQEIQADEDGLRRLQAAHIDNQGFRRFFERMERSEPSSLFLSDHPSNGERMRMAEKFANLEPRPIMSPGEWEALKAGCAD
jgi:predicted Zn-dependent protease